MTSAVLTVDELDVEVPVGTWVIDPAHSSVGFSVRHLMGRVRGTFADVAGSITTGTDLAGCSATATIAMASVNTGMSMRDDDLRSANFFDVETYPDMTFASTGVTVRDGELELTGTLTIRGVARDVALAVEFLGYDETGLQGEPRIGLSATTTILRSDYGVGAGTVEGQKIVVGDKISVQLDLEAAASSS